MVDTRFGVIVVLLAAIALFAAASGASSADDPPVPRPDPSELRFPASTSPLPAAPPGKNPKFSSSIAQLLETAQSVTSGTFEGESAFPRAQASSIGADLASGLIRLDSIGRVQVYIRVSASDERSFHEKVGELESLGIVVERYALDEKLVQARIPIGTLPQLAELEYIRAVTPPDYGYANVGSKMTEGEALLGFDDLRTTLGVDGTGVTVGVISDGIFGLADAIASVDLPATTLIRDGGNVLTGTTGGLIATSFRADGDLEKGLDGVSMGAEGTAILEIVHDIAPGAQLRFANFSTSLEFMAAVDFLAANSDVVIDDIGFFGGPYDQSSSISANTATELGRLSNPIRGYYTSVGNQALLHYQETYVDSLVDGTLIVGSPGNLHQFTATSDTTDCAGLGASLGNLIGLWPGQSAIVILSWDEPLGSVTSDYDLYAVESGTNAINGFSTNNNPALGEPSEFMSVFNNTAGFKFYSIAISNYQNASSAQTFDMFVLGGIALSCNTGAGTAFNYNTLESSVPAQSDSGGGVVSVGAINASDLGVDDIASYSSHGPANNGATKPDVAAIDGVSITGSGGFSSPFFGTSAAAPHVAGLAALLLELRPELSSGEQGDDPVADRATLRNAIIGTAVDLGDAGVDNVFGSGRVNGLNAGQLLIAPTPTPTPTPIPSASTWTLVALSVVFGILVMGYQRRRVVRG